MNIRTNSYAIANFAVVAIYKLHMSIVANFYVSQTHIRTNFAIFADYGVAFQPSVRINDGICTNLHSTFDESACRIHNGYARIHQFIKNTVTHYAFCHSKLFTRVNAHNHIAVFGYNAANFFTAFVQFRENVSQIVFALSVIASQSSQYIKHQGTFNAVDTGVNFFNEFLFSGSVFFFYNAKYIASFITDNTTIAIRIFHYSSQYGSSSASSFMTFVEFFQFFAVQKRSIATQNHSSTGEASQSFFSLHYCVTSTKLFCLQSNFALTSNHFFYQFSFVTNDYNFIISTSYGSSINYMLQHFFAAHFM